MHRVNPRFTVPFRCVLLLHVSFIVKTFSSPHSHVDLLEGLNDDFHTKDIGELPWGGARASRIYTRLHQRQLLDISQK